jgi:PAS domain S-box-containing protein
MARTTRQAMGRNSAAAANAIHPAADETQTRLAALVASSIDAIMSKTTDGIVTSWNPAAEKMFGYTEREMIGQPMALLLPPDRLDEETQAITTTPIREITYGAWRLTPALWRRRQAGPNICCNASNSQPPCTTPARSARRIPFSRRRAS